MMLIIMFDAVLFTAQNFEWIIAVFLLLHRSLNVADDITGITPLQIAVETENIDCIKEMVLCGASLDAVDKNGRTVFHYAARSSNEMIIQACPTCYWLAENNEYLAKLACGDSINKAWDLKHVHLCWTFPAELRLQKLFKIGS